VAQADQPELAEAPATTEGGRRSNRRSRGSERAEFLAGRLGELFLALILAELMARLILGLGTPPLWLAHPTIEYMQRPDQDIYRFGRHFVVNHWGMRSGGLSLTKPRESGGRPSEYRVLAIGDSVLNGGALTAHADLATTLAEPVLTARMGRPVRVANSSAGSWGPGNWLAYVRAYGMFESDLLLLVLSSHDYADNPTYGALDSGDYPVQPPAFAIQEGVQRYLKRYLARYQIWSDAKPVAVHEITPQDIEHASKDLLDLIHLARSRGAAVLAMIHPERREIGAAADDDSQWQPGFGVLTQLFAREGVPVHNLRPDWYAALGRGVAIYRDDIHLSPSGQHELARVMENEVLRMAAVH
jgi:hypothetical protein